MQMWKGILAAAIAVPLVMGVMLAGPGPARAEVQGIIAIANDQPITERDIDQRIALLKLLDDYPPAGMTRQQVLQNLVDDQVKIEEATRLMMLPNDSDVSGQINRLAKGMKYTREELLAKLKSIGISEATFRRYLLATLAFNRIIAAKYREAVTASDAEIDAKMAEINGRISSEMKKIMSDPRMKGITVYSLMEISLPVDSGDPMLLQSRAIEAATVVKRFKGCGNARAAAQGIFDVKIGKKFEADAAKLPKPMRQALEQAGQGGAVGPMRGKDGLQIVAFCGARTITPPKPDFKMPTRDQIQRMVINEKYDKLEEDYLKLAREKVYVEYRNPAYAQQ